METRVQRFKEYRGSLVKEGSDIINRDKKLYTTNTLPLDQVMTATNKAEEDALVLNKRREFKIKVAIVVASLVVITIGIIVFAVFAFR